MGSARRNDPFTLHPLPFTAKDGSGSGLVVRPVFKTAMEAPSAAPVGSIPTRSRHLPLTLIVSVALLLSLTSARLVGQAQPRTAPPAPVPARTDSLTRRYISPSGALWRSLLLPGWGQARLNRKLTAGLFIAWEGVTLGMSLKTLHELDYLRRTTRAGRMTSGRSMRTGWCCWASIMSLPGWRPTSQLTWQIFPATFTSRLYRAAREPGFPGPCGCHELGTDRNIRFRNWGTHRGTGYLRAPASGVH